MVIAADDEEDIDGVNDNFGPDDRVARRGVALNHSRPPLLLPLFNSLPTSQTKAVNTGSNGNVISQSVPLTSAETMNSEH